MSLGIRTMARTAGFAALCLSTLSSADYVLREGTLAVVSSTGATAHAVKFTEAGAAQRAPLPVTALDTLKLGFSIHAAADGAPLQPHQVTVLATGKDTGRSVATPLKTRKSSGKARWELDVARAPPKLLNLSPTGSVALELVVADFSDDHKPLRLPLADIALSQDAVLPYPYWDTKDGQPPAHLEWEKYSLQPELSWTFRAPEKPVHPVVSLFFTAVVLSPWVWLVGAWRYLARDGRASGFSLAATPKPSTLLFLLCLTAQELLIVVYWIGLRLYQYLPAAAVLAIPLVLTGRSALTELQQRRAVQPIVSGGGSAQINKKKASKVE